MVERKTEPRPNEPQTHEVLAGLMINMEGQWIPTRLARLAMVLQNAAFVAPTLGFDKLVVTHMDDEPELTSEIDKALAQLFADRNIVEECRNDQQGFIVPEEQKKQWLERISIIFTPEQREKLKQAGEAASKVANLPVRSVWGRW